MSFENEIKKAFNGTLFSKDNEYNKCISKVIGPAVRSDEIVKKENEKLKEKKLEEELEK